MKEAVSLLAGVIVLIGYWVYAKDILAGKAKPARSARLMFVVLLIITLLQQRDLNSGWLLALTASEALGSLAILALSIRKGVGGITQIDLTCYGLLMVDVTIWLTTKNTLLALHLSVLADLIAFIPTLIKTWRQPWSETAQFFVYGAIAAPLNVVANGQYTYGVLLFPVYLAIANSFEVFLVLWRQKLIPASEPSVR
jgi:hypothetical protein